MNEAKIAVKPEKLCVGKIEPKFIQISTHNTMDFASEERKINQRFKTKKIFSHLFKATISSFQFFISYLMTEK